MRARDCIEHNIEPYEIHLEGSADQAKTFFIKQRLDFYIFYIDGPFERSNKE